MFELDTMTNSYFNDLPCTFFVGIPDTKAKRIFDVVREAVNTVVDDIKHGVRAAELDAISRRVIAKTGYGEYFPHQLGHSIGLQFYELPTLHPSQSGHFGDGNGFAIEPAIYNPGFGGVRLEENVVVTDNICQVITPFSQ